jgi:tetratricopeptide (TPR) repeat protein
MGRNAEAIAELRRALDLDPLSLVIQTDLGYAYFLDRQYDAAVQQYQRVLAIDPAFLPAHFDLMMYYTQRGLYTQEVEELIEDKTLAGYPGLAHKVQRLSANPHKLMEAMAKTGGTLLQSSESSGSASRSARYYLALGARESAMSALERSFRLHENEMIYLKVDPAWNPLHDEPRFQELERKVGLIVP